MAKRKALQFKITLLGVTLPIWRRIQISDLSTFWDLHVAIQDAFGWTDSHLHEFVTINGAAEQEEYIGIPDNGEGPHPVLTGWDIKVEPYVKLPANQKILYLYDFGDNWEHLIEFEGWHEKQANKYPICLAGERACPPEDVGGVPGYENFIAIINDKKHEERKSWLEWVGGKYNSEKFNPKKVKFDSPSKRWRYAFEGEGLVF